MTAEETASGTAPQCKLTAIIAETRRVGVIFRRGPTKQVRLIKWNLANDTFEFGQWFKGRIFEDHCDLSPKGDLLVCFATKTTLEYWTAVSRPPYLTALALWPIGGPFAGGGIFHSDRELCLYHPSFYRELKEGFDKPPIRVHFGRDTWNADLREDGLVGLLREKYAWKLVDAGQESESSYRDRGKIRYLFTKPRVTEKPNGLPNRRSSILRKELLGYNEVRGDYRVLNFHVERHDGTKIEIGRCQWADWDHNGDLLFSQAGALYRLPWTSGYAPDQRQLLADFGDQRFEEVAAPRSALRW